ncbi:MAG: mechanosensitive ion channel [Pseudomonadales bacterium]|nr:mechanosensitive ion channel [Pseudomonadales bacterium]
MDLEKWTQNIVDSTASFWNKIAAFLPNLAATIVIVVVGIFLAKLLSRWAAKLLDKLGLNALCKRIGIAEAMEKAGVEKSPAEILAKFIYFFVMLIVLLTAAETLGLDRITSILDDFVLYLPKILGALFVIIVGMFIAHVVKQSIQTAVNKMGMDYGSSVARLAQVIIFVTTFSLAVGQLEIETAMLNIVFGIVLGSLGVAAAISLGLGTRVVSSNIMSGVYVREQLQPGDEVVIGDFKGAVVSVGTVSTVIENSEGECLSIPNQSLLNKSYRFQSWSDDDSE